MKPIILIFLFSISNIALANECPPEISFNKLRCDDGAYSGSMSFNKTTDDDYALKLFSKNKYILPYSGSRHHGRNDWDVKIYCEDNKVIFEEVLGSNEEKNVVKTKSTLEIITGDELGRMKKYANIGFRLSGYYFGGVWGGLGFHWNDVICVDKKK